jgi:tetratricopeptide (TPR) repeat protein
MIKTIKSKLLPVLAAGAVLAVISGLTGCGSAPKTETDKPEAPSVSKKEVKEEPQDPPNVKFVKQLKALLADNDTKGAIAHFEKIPAELKDDIELKNLLGALYYSDAQYDNAILTAEEILAIEPENMDALELISMCNKAKGDKTAYKASADRILSVDPYNAAVNIQKAEDYALNKKI